MDVLEGEAEGCVGVATAVRLVGCVEVPRLEEDKDANVSVALEELEVAKAVLDDTVELAAADSPEMSIVEKGYGSSEVVRFVSQQLVPPRSCPDAPAQHQLLPLASQRLTSV